MSARLSQVQYVSAADSFSPCPKQEDRAYSYRSDPPGKRQPFVVLMEGPGWVRASSANSTYLNVLAAAFVTNHEPTPPTLPLQRWSPLHKP